MPKARASGAGGGVSVAAGMRAAELELDSAMGQLGTPAGAPGTQLAQGIRRIQSSPTITVQGGKGAAASGSASRKKGGTSSELKNVAATKAARRLARKAEAARQSRRRKKAALVDMESTLLDLETRHAELMRAYDERQASRQHRRGSSGVSNSSSRAGSPSRLLPAPPAMPAAQQSSDSSPPAPTSAAASSSSSLTNRFQQVLAQLTTLRTDECNDKINFVQQHTMSRGVSDVLLWLLAHSRSYSAQMLPEGASSTFLPATSIPSPLGTSLPPSTPPTAIWSEVLRACGVSDLQQAALLTPGLGTTAGQLIDTMDALRVALTSLRPRLASHSRDRDAHNRALYALFTPRQREILAGTAFKQHQAAGGAMAQQQQQHMQQHQQHQQALISPSHSHSSSGTPPAVVSPQPALSHLQAHALQQQQRSQHMAAQHQQQHQHQHQQQHQQQLQQQHRSGNALKLEQQSGVWHSSASVSASTAPSSNVSPLPVHHSSASPLPIYLPTYPASSASAAAAAAAAAGGRRRSSGSSPLVHPSAALPPPSPVHLPMSMPPAAGNTVLTAGSSMPPPTYVPSAHSPKLSSHPHHAQLMHQQHLQQQQLQQQHAAAMRAAAYPSGGHDFQTQ